MQMSEEQRANHIVRTYKNTEQHLQAVLDGLKAIGPRYLVEVCTNTNPAAHAKLTVLGRPVYIECHIVSNESGALETHLRFMLENIDGSFTEQLSVYIDDTGNYGREPFPTGRMYHVGKPQDLGPICTELVSSLVRKV